jgi:hypothetical protein
MNRKLAGNAIRSVVFAWLSVLPASGAKADGAVYAMTNVLGFNEILVYHRAANGNLSLMQRVATGGGGGGLQLTGVDSLGSAGGLRLDPDHDMLFAVNSESAAENNGAGAYNTDCSQGTITSFRVMADGSLVFADRVFSGGLYPDSLAAGANSVYVLNAGGPEPAAAVCHLTPGTANTPNVTGFKVDPLGHMIPLDSTQAIDPGPASASSGVSCTTAAATGFSGLTGAPAADFHCGLNPPAFPRSPGQVLLPSARQLVVTVKGTNSIYVFPLVGGIIGSPTVSQAAGPALPTYSGLAARSATQLLVVETFGTATAIPAGAKGALSTFGIGSTGNLTPKSLDIADGGTGPLSVVVEPHSKLFAYVANNLSASIASYSLAATGAVTLLNGAAASASGPNDLAVAKEGTASFLYALSAGTGTVNAFAIHTDGSLTSITGGGGLPVARSAQGLAAY